MNDYVPDCLPYCTGPPTNPSDSQPFHWRPVSIAQYVYDELVFESELGYNPTPYAHFIDGVQQPGVFLGGASSSTWGFQPAVNTRGQANFALRVVYNTTTLYDGEFTGFIKIDA